MEKSFDCEFDAPQFFDFDGIAQGAEDAAEAERYFDTDHENVPPTAVSTEDEFLRGEAVKGAAEPPPPPPSAAVETAAAASPLRRALSRAKETPTRRSLREKVQRTVAKLSSSTSSSSSSGVKKSPEKTHKSNIIKVATPEILKQMMGRKKLAPTKETTRAKDVGSRLAHYQTEASKARAANSSEALSKASSSSSLNSNNARMQLTRPVGPTFETDKRQQLRMQQQQLQQPVKAHTLDKASFQKMLRNYHHDAVPPLPPRVSRPTSRSLVNRRRSRSCGQSTPLSPRAKVARSQESLNSSRGSMRSRDPSPSNARPFSFVDKDLAKVKQRAEALAREQRTMKATEFKNLLRSYQGSNSAATHAHVKTKPEPFHAARPIRRRSHSADQHQRDDEEEMRHQFKARPAPASTHFASAAGHVGVPNRVGENERVKRAATALQPFSFDGRDAAALVKKQEKIDKVLEQERKDREFKATAMPDLNKTAGIPSREVLPPTKAQPFHHQIERRVEARLDKWQKDLEEDLRRQREAANFRANPASVLTKEPFQPSKSDRPLAEISNFELHSEKRAKEREMYEAERKHKMAEMESKKRELTERRLREEEEEVRRRRQEAVHRAQPVKQYRPLVIKSSDKPVTDPKSPNFSQMHGSRHRE